MKLNNSSPSQIANEIISAQNRIKKFIRKTPLEPSFYLSKDGQNKVFLKLENVQHTGSFKTRGSFNKLLSLTKEQRDRGIIVASTGNHGVATSYALKILKINTKAKVILPRDTSKAKIAKLNKYNISLYFEGYDSEETENFARNQSIIDNEIYISGYNDIKVISGQGTIGIELLDQLSHIDYIFITVGGGGLISGIGSYLKSKDKNIKIIGCLPKNSPVMYESIKAGKIIKMKSKPTLSDGSAGGIEKNSLTFHLCQQLIDKFVLISEEEIENAIKIIFKNHSQVIEGAAGVAVAAYLKEKENVKGNCVIVVCGGNIEIINFLRIVNSE